MKKILLLTLLVSLSFFAKATHFQGGYIQYTWVAPDSLNFSVFFYKDCSSGVDMSSNIPLNILSLSCGIDSTIFLVLAGNSSFTESEADSAREVTDLICGTTSCLSGGTSAGTAVYVYEGGFKLPSLCQDWVFSYNGCCRNNAITNLANTNDWYIEARLDNSTGIQNSSPTLDTATTTPVPGLCAGSLWEYSFGAIDPDGDSLVYTLVPPQGFDFATLTGVDYLYEAPFFETNPFATEQGLILFNDSTGLMTAQPAEGIPQFAVISVLIEEFRDGAWIGSQRRDIQVISSVDCTNDSSGVTADILSNADVVNAEFHDVDGSISACIGQEFSFNFTFTDSSALPPPTGYDIVSNLQLLNYKESKLETSINGTVITGTVTIFVDKESVGLQELEVTVTNKSDTCLIKSATFIYPINIILDLNVEDPLGNPIYYCNTGDSIQLPGNDAGDVTWFSLSGGTPDGLSSDTANHPFAAPSTTTTYLAIAEGAVSQCKNRDSILITVLPIFEMEDSIFNCLDDPLIIAPIWMLEDSTAELFYSWFDGSTDSTIAREGKTQTEDSSKYFRVDITDPVSGCVVSDSVWVAFIECFLDIPNVFTPNGDKINDIFEIDNFDTEQWDLRIYNRWGKEVFSESPYLNAWDGGNLKDGIYYYHLNHQQLRLEHKGWLQISH